VITAVDTNVLLDVCVSHVPHYAQSRQWLTAAYDRGAIFVCDVVYAELSPIDTSIASYAAGLRWSQYRRAGGPRSRIISDCPIEAHAAVFPTRNRGFYGTYFPELHGL